MKKFVVALLVAFVTFMAVPAFAVGPFYLGANYMMNTVEIESVGAPDDVDLDALSLLAGLYLLDDFIAVEARVGFGVGDDTVSSVTSELDTTYGVYARAELPLGMFKPYVIAGLTAAEFSYDAFDEDDKDLSYGAGVDVKLTDSFAVNAEYMFLMEASADSVGLTEKFDVESLSLGLKLYF